MFLQVFIYPLRDFLYSRFGLDMHGSTHQGSLSQQGVTLDFTKYISTYVCSQIISGIARRFEAKSVLLASIGGRQTQQDSI